MSALAKQILDWDAAFPGDGSMDVPAEQWARFVELARGESAPRPYRWAILACSKSKLAHSAEATQLYTGELFKASLAVARKMAGGVLILSAKHGVVAEGTELDPYEQSLPADKHGRLHWGNRVALELNRALGVKDRADMRACEEIGKGVLCLAPESYVSAIGFMYGPRTWARPLKGLGIGEQKAKLKQMLGGAQ